MFNRRHLSGVLKDFGLKRLWLQMPAPESVVLSNLQTLLFQKSKKHFCIFNALLFSTLVYVFFFYLPNFKFDKTSVRGTLQEYTLNNNRHLNKTGGKKEVIKSYTLNNNSHLNKTGGKKEVSKSLPVPLNYNTYGKDIFKARGQEEIRRLLKGYEFDDIMNMKPIRYLDSFKNPCWIGSKDNGPVNDNTTHCFPYFFIIALSGYDPRELSYYVHMYDLVTKSILSEKQSRRGKTSDLITCDASVHYLHSQGVWDLLPGNEGLSEPRYTNFHYIKHLIPQAKIIIIFRNPVDRLYSDFLFELPAQVFDASQFHEKAALMVKMYGNCFREYSFRHCIYNNTFADVFWGIFTPTAGFYAFFMKELRSVFSTNQILPLLFDDYIAKPIETMSKVYNFLELRNLNTHHMQKIIKGPVLNSGAEKKSKSGPMLKKTRKMLNDFYRSLNEDMAELMNDDRYLFSEE